MKKAIFIIFLLNFSFSYSQNIIGTWKWKNEKYEGIAKIDSTKFYNEVYFLNSGTKVLEQFNYYHVEKNKIYLSDRPWSEDPEKKGKTVYKIKDLEEKKMSLSGISEDKYILISNTPPPVYVQQPDNLYYIGGKNVCFSGDKEVELAKCLKFGTIDFSLTYEEVLQKLGKPQKTQYNGTNSMTYFFLVYPSEKSSPILQVTFKDDKINCLELTGSKSEDDYAFSSIRLGDYDTFVKQRLGEPYLKKEVTSPGDETWLFTKVPVTVKFRLHKITSIKIEPI